MKEIHTKVPIIPIIAKSDTMTSAEKKEFKEWVQQKLQEEEIKIFQFDPSTIDEMSRQAEVATGPPWAVMATKDTTIEDGEVKALRIYDWGAADAANPQHSDLLLRCRS
ncbi:hypothetical protein EMIHUDRAFT_252858 [Emiliania huxleyi CCMP1516]|uniref:Septin-type G domain-containing protein n=2 Tax=Emiliania huxleyi TaxID=2903 RepID=A0A0D3IA94_EMIH1|nr:hypothetical protein EMIHUDRAFT_217757 [Emiliania huxleyi CCMP1516]XP_005787030.1 hypothetical protein EMIHUDRAFT_252858 [Emiliania huxleyi CCMP1516]EOD08179.1 hypothetical protein EMIHUDRAFT_217757 [Emiliania huxleyi CCMP1516]EOD34601.1 hypothetical protein EMIHUDRAFT_252858 [Emiliania huxleyi CCMP1516]|eukprot:XP_005760608.1 hypothetical protein EMIHUDRAFT_217757 [Emiliania huxleyi CCMP1516]